MEKKFKIDKNYFETKPSKLKTKIILSKYNFSEIDIFDEKPCIYLTPSISEIDKYLISKCMNIKFVFLKAELIFQINFNLVSENEEKEIIRKIEELKNFGYSLSIIFNSSPTIFGETEKLTEKLIHILAKTNLDIKFLTFPGAYFSNPVWSDEDRKNKIYAYQKSTIKGTDLIGLSKKNIIKVFENHLPSSATKYLQKYKANIISNRTAEHLERVIYACPFCKKLLSLYSEFSCVKCKNCGNAFELSNDGQINFSKTLSNFDEIQNFQFNVLKSNDFDINSIITYNKITQFYVENCKIQSKYDIILQIYPEKLKITLPKTNKTKVYFYEDIEYVLILKHNTILIKPKNAKQFYFSSKSNQNLLIIKDLVKLNKN